MSADGPWYPPTDRPSHEPPHDRSPDVPATWRDPAAGSWGAGWGGAPGHGRDAREPGAYGGGPLGVGPHYEPGALARRAHEREEEEARWQEEQLAGRPDRGPRRRRGADPDGPDDRGGRSRRGLVVAVAVVAVLAVGAVGVRQLAGGDEAGGGGGWEVEELGNSQMLTSDGERVCSTTQTKLVYCVDGATGEELFSVQLYDNVVTSPVLAGDRLVVAGYRAQSTSSLYGYSLDGVQQWELPVNITTDRPMPVVGGVLAVVSGDDTNGTLVGIDVESGTEVWRSYEAQAETQVHVVGANAFTDGERFYTAVAQADPDAPTGITGWVVAVDVATGAELWRSPSLPSVRWAQGIGTVALYADRSAVAIGLDGAEGQAVVLDTATGELRWEADLAGERPAVAHVDGVTMVVDSTDMRAYDVLGDQLWATSTPVPPDDDGLTGLHTVVVRDGLVFVVGQGVYQVDPGDGGSGMVHESGTTSDVAIAGDHVVATGVFALSAVPVDELPLRELPVTAVTG